MLKIRKKVFETNSSSSHVITFDEMGDESFTFLPGNYLLKLTDEFSGMDFDVDYIRPYVQNPEQKLRYLYVYCAWHPKLLRLFKAAIAKYADWHPGANGIHIDLDPEEEKKLYYYNIAQDYLMDNDYIINHNSCDMLEEQFKLSKMKPQETVELFANILRDSRYVIRNGEPDLFEAEEKPEND